MRINGYKFKAGDRGRMVARANPKQPTFTILDIRNGIVFVK